MLQKLRSRHGVDLPYSGFGTKKGILTVLGGIAALFVIIPFLLSPLAAANESVRRAAILIGAGVGTLVFVLLVAGIRGKFGWQR
jgi:hypothetical protein